MHISFGMPLISAEHEPHLPALQFQRTARSWPAPLGSGGRRRAPPFLREAGWIVLELPAGRVAAPDAKHGPIAHIHLLDDLFHSVGQRHDRLA